eukprot:10356194-Lingulodinium_polyedra.AAC.1
MLGLYASAGRRQPLGQSNHMGKAGRRRGQRRGRACGSLPRPAQGPRAGQRHPGPGHAHPDNPRA